MKSDFLVFLVPLALILALVFSPRLRRARVRDRLRAAWGKGAPGRTLEKELVEDEAAAWRVLSGALPPEDTVDDITWQDLDMDAVFCRLDNCPSVVGSEALYAMLRQTGVDSATLQRRQAIIEALRADEEARLDIQEAARKIGRRHFHGALEFLQGARGDDPGPGYWLLAAAPFLFLLGGLIDSAFLWGIALSFCVNLIVHYRAEIAWSRQLNAVTHIATVLQAAQQLSRSKAAGIAPEVDALRGFCARLRVLRRFSRLCGEADDGRSDPAAIAREYLKIAFLTNILSLRRASGEIARHAEDVRALYAAMGELEALFSAAALREDGENTCLAAFEDAPGARFEGLTHPLVSHPVPNGWAWAKNTLVTGSNASGKSTFLKAVAVNAILAQTLGICWATSFRLRRARVMTSMAVRDDVRSGESYFVAELRSLGRILAAAEGPRPLLAFVDEILRGTNTIERIAASASVLHSLEGKDILVLAATHDIELTRILQSYANIHFRETVGEAGVTFDYKLHPGLSRTRNALALLAQMGFGEATVRRARAMAEHFERTRAWETL